MNELLDALDDYLEAQDGLDNREAMGPNAECYWKLMARRNDAREFLDKAIAEAKPAPVADALDAAQINAAAKELTKRLDYPWEFMTDEGRETMRDNVRCVFAAAKAAAQKVVT